MEDKSVIVASLSLRSEEMQEILGRPPRKILRVGISIIFVVLAGLFFGSYFLRYPDILPATITVTTKNLPVGVMSMSTGKIDTFAVKEKQIVKEGDILAIINNTAIFEDIIWVKAMLEELDMSLKSWSDASQYTTNIRNVTEMIYGISLQLGDVQPSYIAFDKALMDYYHFISTDYHNHKIDIIRKQIITHKKILKNIANQLQITEKQLAMEYNLYSIDSSLYTKKMLSLSDYQSSKSSFLQQLSFVESARISVDNQQMNILQLEQSIFDLEEQRIDEEQQLKLILTSAIEHLSAQIRQWEQTYMLIAPCDGKVTLTKYWQKNQNVNIGEVLVTVVPNGMTQVVGRILLPQRGAGKVKVGQTINVKFDNFPYLEYGLVRVSIRDISLVPVQIDERTKAYILEVEFPEKLVTTYGKELPFSQEMTGTAEIITNDQRLLDKLLNPIKLVIDK